MKRVKFIFSILWISLAASACQSTTIHFPEKPSFTETDSSITRTGYWNRNKHDYYVVQTGTKDIDKILPIIDSFMHKNAPKAGTPDINTTVWFYRETADVNEKELAEYHGAEYKLFQNNKKDILAIYVYRDTALVEINTDIH